MSPKAQKMINDTLECPAKAGHGVEIQPSSGHVYTHAVVGDPAPSLEHANAGPYLAGLSRTKSVQRCADYRSISAIGQKRPFV
jgi:hypothetical protein